MSGQIGTITGDIRGFRIFYTDGTSYRSVSNLSLPNLRDEWNAQTKEGIILVIVRFHDRYETYNRNGILVTRWYREFMPYAPAGAADWRVWYHPRTRSFGAGPAVTMPNRAEWKDYSDSAIVVVDNSDNEQDDVLSPYIGQIRAAYRWSYRDAGRGDD